MHELELKAEHEKAPLEAKIEAKKEAAAREHELKMAGLVKHFPSDRGSTFDSARSCGHCGKPGHIATNCWKLGGKTPCEHCGKFNQVRIVELPRISCKQKLNPQGYLA